MHARALDLVRANLRDKIEKNILAPFYCFTIERFSIACHKTKTK